MRKLKLVMDQKNYMGINQTHIFINFNNGNLEYLNTLNPQSIHIIHVFIANHTAINDTLKRMIHYYKNIKVDGHDHCVKIVLHVPKPFLELASFAKKFIGANDKYQVITERKGTWFKTEAPVYNSPDEIKSYKLIIGFDENGIKVGMYGMTEELPVLIKFPEYRYDSCNMYDAGIFETNEMRINPSEFKEKLVEAFKKNTPPGILKSFKNDDDIFNYITEQGTWSSSKVESVRRPVEPLKGHNAIRGLTETETCIDDHSFSESGPTIGIVGGGKTPITSKLLDAVKDGKIIICDSLGSLEKPPLPEILPGQPRNRAERRQNMKGGKRK